ncbi:MAG: hypothetical protein J6R42_02455 [Clostridia bacterium]|nr:hypothetical protein [Clostridia bacterium]
MTETNQSSIAELTEEGKVPFTLTPEQKARVMEKLSATPISSAQLVMKMNGAIDGKRMRLLRTKDLDEGLVGHGFLAYAKADSGKIIKTPTQKGEKAGISTITHKLAGGGTEPQIVLANQTQVYIVHHIHALLGLDAALDQDIPKASSGAPTVSESADTPKKTKPAHFQFCWDCEGKYTPSLAFRCKTCGWPICPKCGACRSARAGGCVESKKGLSRFTGIEKEKNEIRALLQNHGLLDRGMFVELCEVSSPAQLAQFKAKYATAFTQIENLRQAKREERVDEQAEHLREIKRNQRGFYRIVSVNDRFLTYVTAAGVKKTIPNKPPVRIGKEYADLSGVLPK